MFGAKFRNARMLAFALALYSPIRHDTTWLPPDNPMYHLNQTLPSTLNKKKEKNSVGE